MKRLDRYLLKEMIGPMLVGTVIIALLFMANEVIAIFKNFDVSHLPKVAVVQMVMFRMPHWLSMTLPAGTAIGVALAISRMARESEITAMRAAGIPLRRLLLPVAFMGLLAAVANYLIVEKLIPPAALKYRQVVNQASVLGPGPVFRSNVMLSLDGKSASFGSVQRTADGRILLKDILLIERPRAGESVVFSAAEGSYDDGVWYFQSPLIRFFSGGELVSIKTEDVVTINERIRIADMFIQPMAEEETAADLKEAIEDRKRSGGDTTLLEVAYHVKFSLPSSCLVFALTSAIMALALVRSGPFVGLIVSMVLVMAYYNIHIVATEIVGRYGWLPPGPSAWLPNIIFATVAAVVLWRIE